ncbi:MAG: tetratricopeptide repeat protein [Saprospiraceae bacterium]|nr:tetratricopeptide repeat protein [Saprospiraceae bacterium]
MPKKHRQLAAIVFTDIVGYSKLMREDEEKATLMRARHRAVFDNLTPKYGGKILQYYGDGTLSIFQSSVAAVECSVEMQKSFQETPNVPLRIGIHSGDITYSKEEVFGDALNTTSRIETACIPGGVFVSNKVYDDIKNHSWLSAKSVGEFQFKGNQDFIEIYAVNNEGLPFPTDPQLSHLKESKAKIVNVNSTISGSKSHSPNYLKKLSQAFLGLLALMTIFYLSNSFFEKEQVNYLANLPESDQISIAVLPFSNFSESKEDEYFSDGITEDILTVLSNIKDFRVISRTSVMQYKNTEKSIPRIGRELNATHILEGSVRKSDNKVRVVAQLIDARNDTHIWADTYDREMTEIFEVQSEVAEQIAGMLKMELSPQDCEMIQRKPTDNLQAYEYYLQGRKYYTNYQEKDNEIAIQLFEKALEIDSNFALAYAGLGDALSQKSNFKYGNPELLNTAMQMSQKAIQIDSNSSEGYKALGLSYHYQGEKEKAMESYYQAVEINPNNEMAISNIALICQEEGKFVEGIDWAEKAMELNPQHQMSFLRLSELYESIGLDEKAETILVEGIGWNPDNEELNFRLGNLELKLNHLDKAKEKAASLAKNKPESPTAPVLLGKVAFFEKDYEKAKEYYIKAKELAQKKKGSKKHWDLEMELAFIEDKLSAETQNSSQLHKLLADLEKEETKHPKKQFQLMIAAIYSVLNEEEKAIECLKKATEQGFLDYKMLENNPIFEDLKGKDLFKNIQKEVQRKAEEIQRKVSKEIS